MTKWVTKKLGDCCTTELGKTLDGGRNTGEYRPYLCALNILWGKVDKSSIKKMRIDDEELERYLVRKGDLLVCEGGEIGRCAIWDSDEEIYYQNALHRVRFKEDYSTLFFMYLLCHLNDLKQIEQYGKGLTIKHLNQTSFRNIPVTIPESLAEQCRIAAILGSADKVIATSGALIEKYKHIKQGLLTDLLQPKEGWKKETLSSVCVKITDGCHNKPKGVERSDFIMLSSQNIQDNNLDLTDVSFLTKEDFERENQRTDAQADDVLLTIVGTVGRIYLIKENDIKFTLQRSVAVLRPDKTKITSEFLLYYLNYSQGILENEAHGCAQKGIYLKQLGNLNFTYPTDLSEQRRIASILSSIDAKILAEEKVVEKYKGVKKGLMERMMKGEITKK